MVSHCPNENPAIPPAPLDPKALEETWELVRLAKAKNQDRSSKEDLLADQDLISSTCTTSLTSYIDTDGSQGAFLSPRGIRRYSDGDVLLKLTSITFKEESMASDQFTETVEVTERIDKEIEELVTEWPTNEAQWRFRFVHKYFFPPGHPDDPYKCLVKERQQLVTYTKDQNRNNVITGSRIPPLRHGARESRDCAKEPKEEKMDSNGYIFSDQSFAFAMPEDLLGLFRSTERSGLVPGCRLYEKTKQHLVEEILIDIKPLYRSKGDTENLKRQSRRYLSLLASTILYERLQLCYLVSGEEFEDPGNLVVFLVSAVGHCAALLACYVREEKSEPVQYFTRVMREYDLQDRTDRSLFREHIDNWHTAQRNYYHKLQASQIRRALELSKSDFDGRLANLKGVDFKFQKKGTKFKAILAQNAGSNTDAEQDAVVPPETASGTKEQDAASYPSVSRGLNEGEQCQCRSILGSEIGESQKSNGVNFNPPPDGISSTDAELAPLTCLFIKNNGEQCKAGLL